MYLVIQESILTNLLNKLLSFYGFCLNILKGVIHVLGQIKKLLLIKQLLYLTCVI